MKKGIDKRKFSRLYWHGGDNSDYWAWLREERNIMRWAKLPLFRKIKAAAKGDKFLNQLYAKQ